eukprot:maker-scaffold579_size130606-snap-gene-0.32 protein:Tk02370 transcript:maker-scaffold579_size130606-snap-gene-0.32-mRNA-1 annotation:"hypothetical protein X777_05329"
MCRICWTPTAEGDFEATGAMTGASGKARFNDLCCIGAMGNFGDCVILPSAVSMANNMPNRLFDKGLCGAEFGAADDNTAAATVCSLATPFQLRFLSDGSELVADAVKTPNGLRLAYIQTAC